MEKCRICEMEPCESVEGTVINHHVYVEFDHRLVFDGEDGRQPREVMRQAGKFYYTVRECLWWGETECAKGLFLFSYRNKYGFADAGTGEIVIEPRYEAAGWMEEYRKENGEYGAWASVRQNGKTGYINETGEVILPLEYDDGKEFPLRIGGQYYFAVKRIGKWGLVDRENHAVLDFQYDGIGKTWRFGRSAEYILLTKKYKDSGEFAYGVLSESLEVTVPAILERRPEAVKTCGEETEYFYICHKRKWGLMDRSGRVVREIRYLKREVDAWVKENAGTAVL